MHTSLLPLNVAVTPRNVWRRGGVSQFIFGTIRVSKTEGRGEEGGGGRRGGKMRDREKDNNKLQG